MAGALAERDFVQKLKRVNFTEIEIIQREPFGIAEAELYPLFTKELIDIMRRTIPAEKHDHVATSVVLKARLESPSVRSPSQPAP